MGAQGRRRRQLFYSTQIPACLWFLARDKKNGRFRDRRGHLLFIDARKLGRMLDRTQRELTEEVVVRITGTYHAWRGDNGAEKYEDIAGFCKSATIDEVRALQYVLTPGRYVGAKDLEDDEESFEISFARLSHALKAQFSRANRLHQQILKNLEKLQ